MYIVRFQGGLGNQMFQAAFFRMLECMYPRQRILVDLTAYSDRRYHQGYELKKIFNMKLPEASSKEIRTLSHYVPIPRKWSVMAKLWRKLFSSNRKKKSEICEDTYSIQKCEEFYADLFPLKEDNLFFEGFWVWKFEKAYQVKTASIIEDWKSRVEKDFVFSKAVYEEKAEQIIQMQEAQSVSVHLRRGDYVGTGFDVCAQEYYEAARAYLEKRIRKPVYYVFSDDMEYAKMAFKNWGNINFVENNKNDEAWKDMFLMSQCRHHIIANSTFSFWGAYLGTMENTITIAPKEYYNGKKGFCLAKESWITL